MNHWLSRRHPRYVRSLAYMLQASEYDIRNFWLWHERVRDFTRVENRKQLVLTPKASILLASGWIAVAAAVAAALYALVFLVSPWNYIIALVLLVEAPLFALCGTVLITLVLRFFQIPIEILRTTRTRRNLARHPGVKIAIAGSYGKTSMREILRTVLSAGKIVASPPGSHNTPLAVSSFVDSLKGDEDVLIFELGEYYPGDVWKLSDMVQPDIGIITGVNEAHLEKFGSLETTAKTIFELSEWLGDKPLYVNGENEAARKHAPKHAVLFGREGTGEWRAEYPHTDLSGTRFRLSRKELHLDVASKLMGLHMVGPLSVAADIAFKLGLTPDQLRVGLASTEPFEHRLQLRSSEGGITTLDDSYNGNPDGVKAVIEFLSSLQGRRIYVTPGLVEMGKRNEVVHKEIGRELARAGIEKTVLIRNSVTRHIEEGLKEAGYKGEIVWFDDGLTAYKALPSMTVAGDIVLLQNDWPDQYF